MVDNSEYTLSKDTIYRNNIVYQEKELDLLEATYEQEIQQSITGSDFNIIRKIIDDEKSLEEVIQTQKKVIEDLFKIKLN